MICQLARGRFPDFRVDIALKPSPDPKVRVTQTELRATLRLQWRDRAGIRPASLLPSFYGGTLSNAHNDSADFYFALSPVTTGLFSFVHRLYPPTIACAGTPIFCRVCAARALVCSLGQEQ